MKIYINALLALVLSLSILNASVVIKLGSYSNKENSQRQVLRIQEELGFKSSVIEEGGIYRLYSLSFDTREKALDLLPTYQKLFPDAYIMQSTRPYKAPNIKMDKKQLDKTTIPLEMVKLEIPKTQINTPKENIPKTIVRENKDSSKIITPKSNTKQELSLASIIKGHTFYLCPNVIKSKKGIILIEAYYDNEHRVTYRTLVGKMPSIRINYLIHNERLYTSRSYTFNPTEYNVIEDTLFEYYLMAKYSRYKKLGSMRYYKSYENAKAYLNSLRF